MPNAYAIRVRGVVQGVGFRPFVYRLAHAHALRGWVLNGEEGVQIHVEGSEEGLTQFLRELRDSAPPAASISEIDLKVVDQEGFSAFSIRGSERRDHPTVRISPDLAICDECLAELFDPEDQRSAYPFINCTNCGPRYSIIERLPYDRANTTMKDWPMDAFCSHEYLDPLNRRFHAQPVACPVCGPGYVLQESGSASVKQNDAIVKTAVLLKRGKIVAVKGIGGYHLACDAHNASSIEQMRERKFRKEKPFAVMVRDIATARKCVHLSADAAELLSSVARPIVLAPAKVNLQGVAPDNRELGVMLPYTPLHHLLFAAGAPEILVMTSANRSNEPIAYEDQDALESLAGIADGFLIGERPIARRVEDSVARAGTFGPAILRRSRGYAPGAVAAFPGKRPILALGPELKNTITLVVDGQAFVSQHIGDLTHYEAFRAFRESINDLVTMYEVSWKDLLLVHDCHPQYASTTYSAELPASSRHSVQHHRAHIASVLAERSEWEKRVVGISFDGTGYGDDGSIWGGEFFVGSIAEGFRRVGHLRSAKLCGGDAAAVFPVQAAAGYVHQLETLPDLVASPFCFPDRFRTALDLVQRNVRCFPTTSVGRLFDTAAALLGYTRQISYEGQAAIWLEQVARNSPAADSYPFPFVNNELDFRPLLDGLIRDRLKQKEPSEIARAFQLGVSTGLWQAATSLCDAHNLDTVVLSGGVFQNELLLEDLKRESAGGRLQIWTNRQVPPNDGGISLGQAALAAFGRFDSLA